MLRDLVIKNRSYRGYDEARKMTREELLEFVDLTRYTASSVNSQPLKYYISCDKTEVNEIQKLTHWAAALPQIELPYPGTMPTGFIIICQDTNINNSSTMFLRDIGVVAQTMLLAATEKGLGGCMIGNFNKNELKTLLGFSENIEPNLIVAFGKPAEKIILTDVGTDGNTRYYRDESGTIHYVPKRSLNDILIG